jgi:hypothetical protein
MPFASRSEEASRLGAQGFFSILLQVSGALSLTFHLEKQKKPMAWSPRFFLKKLVIGVQEVQLWLSL